MCSGSFVSQYYELGDNEVMSYMERKRFAAKCPLCGKPTFGKPSNQFKLYVERKSGAFFCHRCGSKGSWYDLKRRLGDLPDIQGGVSGHCSAAASSPRRREGVTHAKSPSLQGSDVAAAAHNLCTANKFPNVFAYLTKQRGLDLSTLQKYAVGATNWPFAVQATASARAQWTAVECMVFPMLKSPGALDSATVEISCQKVEFAKAKIRSITDKKLMQTQPTLAQGGTYGLFGLHTVPEGTKEVVLTEGELDAMSVWQATGAPAISLPNGANSLPPEVLPLLEGFERVYLWMDADAAGSAGLQRILQKLGRGRCMIVQAPRDAGGNPLKDANDALRAGADIRQCLKDATPCLHDQVVNITDLAREVAAEVFSPPSRTGAAYSSLPPLNRAVHGFRTGELNILTGPTGSGKTTLLSQMSVDLAKQGVSTLWGSFEIPIARLCKVMLKQQFGAQCMQSPQDLDNAIEAFSQWPLHFLKFYGSTDVHSVLDAMDYAVYRHDVSHILLDNLQFMMAARALSRGGGDKFDAQDRALDEFRQFASARNVSVSVVIHPRKEAAGAALGIASVFGSAKATQEADNVWIVQVAADGSKSLEVKKNRYSGELASVPLAFDASASRFVVPGEETPLGSLPSTAAPQSAARSAFGGAPVEQLPDRDLVEGALARDVTNALNSSLNGGVSDGSGSLTGHGGGACPGSPPSNGRLAWRQGDIIAG